MKNYLVVLLMLAAVNVSGQWQPDVRFTIALGDSFTSWNNAWCVASNVNNVHVVWFDYRHGHPEIYYKRSTDDGINWGVERRLTNYGNGSLSPSIAVSGSVVHIVWHDFRDGNPEIYYKRSTDDGINWSADIRLTNNTTNSRKPSIAVSGSIVHVVYNVIQYKRSTDSGENWSADVPLLNDAFLGVPSIAVSGSNVHVVWTDYRDNYEEIYYIRSINSGINWSADTRLTNNTADSWYPSIAVSGTLLHVVWMDNRDGNYEIYYKRNPTGNVGIQNVNTEIPSAFSLGQNYPNPFNAGTKIRFEVANGFPVKTSGNDKVVLKVYDVMGREVETLVNERLQAGTYETSFDGSGLTSGVYFYRLVTDGFSETKRMVLVK